MSDDNSVKPWRDLVRRFVEDAIGLCEESECSNLPAYCYCPPSSNPFDDNCPVYVCASHAQSHSGAWKVDWAPVLHDTLTMLGEAE